MTIWTPCVLNIDYYNFGTLGHPQCRLKSTIYLQATKSGLSMSEKFPAHFLVVCQVSGPWPGRQKSSPSLTYLISLNSLGVPGLADWKQCCGIWLKEFRIYCLDEFHTFTTTVAIIDPGAHANAVWWEMDRFVVGISNIVFICIQVGFVPPVTMGKCPFMHIKLNFAAFVTILWSVNRSVENI